MTIRPKKCWNVTGRDAFAAGMIAAMLLIGSCRKHSASDSAGTAKAVLTYWSATAPAEIEMARVAVNEWNASHPDILVHLQPIPASQSSEEVLLAAVAAKTTPDICSNIWPGAICELIEANGLIRPDQFPDFNDFARERFEPGFLDQFRWRDGGLYQMPWKNNPIMMLYNKKIFAEAGVTSVPRTYSEYLAAAGKIARHSISGKVEHWMGMSSIQPIWWHRMFDYYSFYVAASGGVGLFRDDHVAFGNDASVKVFAFFEQLYAKKYFPLTGFQGDPFVNSYVATLFVGPWHLAYLEKNKKPGFEYDVAPVPVPDDYTGPSRAFGSMKSICIFKTSKFPAQAWEFAKFLMSRENDFRVLSETSQIPCRKNLDSDPMYANFLASHAQLAEFAAQARTAGDVDANPNLKEVLDAIAQEYEACVLHQAKTPQQAVDDAVKQAKVIVQWNK